MPETQKVLRALINIRPWTAAIFAGAIVIIAMAVMGFGFELRCASGGCSLTKLEPPLLLADTKIRNLVVKELSQQPLYVTFDRAVYTVRGLTSDTARVELDVGTSTSVKNSSSRHEDYPIGFLSRHIVGNPSLRINQEQRLPTSSRPDKSDPSVTQYDFGTILMPPGSQLHLEYTWRISAPFPFHDLDNLKLAALDRELLIRVPLPLDPKIKARVTPVFSSEYLLQRGAESSNSDYHEYTWKTTKTGALFPYQGYILEIDRVGPDVRK